MIITSFPEAIRKAYAAGQEDEALEPIVRVDAAAGRSARSSNGDSVIFYDIRGEREVELTESPRRPGFPAFSRPAPRPPFRHPHRILAVPGRQGRLPAGGTPQEHAGRGRRRPPASG